jgi:hypothetical protein
MRLSFVNLLAAATHVSADLYIDGCKYVCRSRTYRTLSSVYVRGLLFAFKLPQTFHVEPTDEFVVDYMESARGGVHALIECAAGKVTKDEVRFKRAEKQFEAHYKRYSEMVVDQMIAGLERIEG